VPEAKHAGDFVVAIGEHIGFDDHPIAYDALHGEASTVDFRYDAIDNRAHPAILVAAPADFE
jgi:hypothetical protein